jgi:RNA polymerase sigma-70 factor (ECF subfamily)
VTSAGRRSSSLAGPDFDDSGEGIGQARSTAEEVARRSYGKLVAFLAARTRDVAAAEDALSEAFATALTDWPRNGGPANPEAWLLTVARRKAIDMHRSQSRYDPAPEDLPSTEDVTAAGAEIPDQRLALMFACAHPAIHPGIRAPLILQAVLGLDAARIASAFLTSPTAMGKRLVRAKEKISEAGIPFKIPERDELSPRLEAVLDAIYAAFAEGWTAPTGTDAVRRDLAAEALFLARLVHELLPREPETGGLLALILYAESRRGTRRAPGGEYVPLAAQNPELWNSEMIAEAETLLRTTSKFSRIGRYQLEAALQSAHASRIRTGKQNWSEVAQLYDALFALTQSPVVAINRALALAETDSPAAALEALDLLSQDARLTGYQPWWVARADLLARTGAHDQARHAYEIAIGLEPDPAIRRFLQQRQSALPGGAL